MAKKSDKPTPVEWGSGIDYEDCLRRDRKLNTSCVGYLVQPNGNVSSDIVTIKARSGAKFKGDIRAVRRVRALMDQKERRLSKGAMRNHALIILVGPDTDPKLAVLGLEKVADDIRKRGLDTGGKLTGISQYERH